MNPALGQWGPVAVIVGGYLLGIYFQNRRFDDLRELLHSEVKRLDERLIRLDERMNRLDERMDRLEQAAVRQS